MLNLYDELIQVIRRLTEAEIPCLLCGGLAYSLHVEARNTEDIDLLILPVDWTRCVDTLKDLGFLDYSGALDFKNIRIRRLVKIEGADTLVLDFLLADGDLSNAFDTAVAYTIEGVKIRVVDIPTLIHLKRGRMSDKDKLDIANLEKVLRGEFNRSH